jgi:polyhydroxybutyrate depolymerase
MFAGNASANAQEVSFGGPRPFKLFVPSTYNASFQAPLILALHGYSQSGAKFEKYLNLTPIAEVRGILYVAPDGSADKLGTRFWNATPECCDFHSPKVNDDSYLMSIIDEVSKKYAVDPERIYVIGHSNGGFMANRMACMHADVFAAAVSLAGGIFEKTSLCKPTTPISVLEIWGTKDVTYKSNHIMGKYIPGAAKTAAIWAAIDHCSKTMLVMSGKLDLDSKLKGPETTVGQYSECSGNADVEFWSIAGADHVPKLSNNFTADVVDFLLAHPKVTSEQSE